MNGLVNGIEEEIREHYEGVVKNMFETWDAIRGVKYEKEAREIREIAQRIGKKEGINTKRYWV